ncbi:MAG: DUF4369 domain-containing protein [Bacteroidota bacterium]
MKKILFTVLATVLIFSCSKESENTMYVKGNVKGLKKGTIYLQKQIDSLIVSVDSAVVKGSSEFLLEDKIVSPEMYYLALKDTKKKIPFFGEKDTVSITTNLDKFVVRAKIKGSENQDLLDDYYDIKSKFNDQNLDLIKAEFEAKISGNQDSIALVEKSLKNLIRRKYLYTTNFAINNAAYEVAPYIALTELNNATLKLLDTINASLSPKVKESTYGKQLDDFINKIKETEE